MELSRTPVAVICAGVKSILDIPRTLEYLETHAVPVIGYKTGQFPAFFTQDSGLPAQVRADSPRQIAEIIQESTNLNLPSGFVIAVPNPNPVPTDIIDNAIKVCMVDILISSNN
jgi:pseudouridine-5'-phosphate glycosidase